MTEEKKRVSPFLAGRRILPPPVTGRESVAELVEKTFCAYNAARLREACLLFAEKMLAPDVTVGMSLAGALTPAGLGCSCIVPLVEAGFVDWIVSTGANLYHDLHFAFNLPLYAGTPAADDVELRREGVVRIYDVFLHAEECLFRTDDILRGILSSGEFSREMSTAELHHLLGKHAAAHEERHGRKGVSLLAAAWRAGVPVFTSSPGDSAIGMNIAARALEGVEVRINPSLDVNMTTAIVLAAKRSGGKTGLLVAGGGSPKNFMLQTEPQIQEILKLEECGHDYFLQFTDARPDTGGLSGATPREAVSWGKIDPSRVADTVVCYGDVTVLLPLLTHYALNNAARRKPRMVYHSLGRMVEEMRREYLVKMKGESGTSPGSGG